MNRREEILDALKYVELLSSPALGVLQLLNEADVEAEKIGRAIELDAALTTNVLRFANSAYFGCRREIHTIKEALVRLGVKTIARMIYMSAASQLAPHSVKGFDLKPGVLWEHLVSTAVATELLSSQLNIIAAPHTFTAALLHDIGKLVLGTNLEVDVEPIRELAQEEDIPFAEAEFRILGIDHAEVGAELLKGWNLPKMIYEPIRWHLNPNGYPDDDKVVVDLLHAANVISMLCGTGLGVDGLNYEVCQETQERLGVTTATIEYVMCNLSFHVEKLTSIVDVN